jgi:DNA-binding transcriptional ArsR family regulator
MGVQITQEQAPADVIGSPARPDTLSNRAGADLTSPTTDPRSPTTDPRSPTTDPRLPTTDPFSRRPDPLSHPAAPPLSHPAKDEMELAAILHALSDPMRLRIVAGLALENDRTCKSFDLPVTKSTCTHHFRVLREAGLIRQKLEGTTRLNSLRREELDERFPGLLDSVLRAAQLQGPPPQL